MFTFLKQYITYGLGLALTRLAALLLLPMYTRYLTPADYGVLDTMMTMITFLTPILFLGGMDTGIQILFFNLPEKERQNDLVMTTITLVAGFAGLCVAGGMLSAPFWSQLLFKSEDYIPALRLLLADLLCVTLLKLFLDNLRLRHKPLQYNIFIAGQVVLVTGLNIVFVVILRWGMIGYIMGLTAGDALITAVLGALVLKRHWRVPTFQYALSLLRISLPLLPVSAAYWVLNLSNRFFLVKWTTLADVGLYGIANRLAAGIGIFALALQLGWRPFALSIQSKPESRSLYAAMPLYYFSVVGGIGLVMSALSLWLLKIFTTDAYVQAAILIPPLVLAQVMYGAYYIFSTGLEIRQQTYHLTWTVTVAALFSVVGNVLLIPPFGALGAALVMGLAYCLAVLLVGLISQRLYPLPYDRLRLTAIIACLLGGYLLLTLLPKYTGALAPICGILCTTVFGIIVTALMMPEIRVFWEKAKMRLAKMRKCKIINPRTEG